MMQYLDNPARYGRLTQVANNESYHTSSCHHNVNLCHDPKLGKYGSMAKVTGPRTRSSRRRQPSMIAK
jgi:hypothetical protein